MTESLDRLDELLLREVTGHLSDGEQAELEVLLAEHQSVDRHAYERAASIFFLAVCAEPIERIPETLRSKLSSEATRALSSGA